LFLCFVFSYLLVFPFSFSFFISISSHPSILNITSAIITS
jgi:Sec-independent protein secretion pathway component TatC